MSRAPCRLVDRLRGVKISEQLDAMIRRASPQAHAQLLAMLDYYLEQLRRAHREQQPSPGGRAAGVHDAMAQPLRNAWAKPPAGHTVQCRAGCASCCRLMITVFPDEAVLALFAAESVGVVPDRTRLERQATARTLREWNALSREDRTCVFLRDERCSIYEHRPSACRKYAVVSPPELCDTDLHPGHRVDMVVSAEAEIITSAAMTVWGRAPWPEALIAALDEAEKSRPGESGGVRMMES
jgi:hypothetical protein